MDKIMKPSKLVEYKLFEGMDNESKFISIRQGSTIKFSLNSALGQKMPRLFSNYPLEKRDFDRSIFYELPVLKNSLDVHYEIKDVDKSGSFMFILTTFGNDIDIENKERNSARGYFSVEPQFYTLNNTKTINLDAIVMQTFITKNLGKLSEWESRLSTAKETNYNIIHLTPVQYLGYSHSAYSLRNQHLMDPCYVENPSDGWNKLNSIVKTLDNEHGILTICDLVLNHTASNSEWILEHPECGYNLINSPYLTGAYVLDRILWNISIQASNGCLESRGIPCKDFQKYKNLYNDLRDYTWEKVNEAKIYEFYLLDVDQIVDQFFDWLKNPSIQDDTIPCPNCKSPNNLCSFHAYNENDEIPFKIIYGGRKSRQRYGATINFNHVARLFFKSNHCQSLIVNSNLDGIKDNLMRLLTNMNNDKYHEISCHLGKSVENYLANFKYRFLDKNGPQCNSVGYENPFMWNYFYQENIDKLKSLDEIEEECKSEMKSKSIMIYNGWVMGDDPMKNFAEEPSNVYLRRELIVWGDSVKLRYGHSREVCPFLWDHMKRYSELTGEIFHGVRLDNCHSTPIHVAQYMLDAARKMRPNIYIIAELFTGNEDVDNIFVNKLGINSLIREALQVNSCFELGSQSHHYGASQPAGSFQTTNKGCIEELKPKIAHGLFYDMTHDNQSPAILRSLHDYLPTAGVLSTVCCAIASTRGFDEMVPHQIDVVTEPRPYSKLDNVELKMNHGVLKAKCFLNNLHRDLNERGFNQTFIDQVAENVLAISRFCPQTGSSIVTITHSAFKDPGLRPPHYPVKKIKLNGLVDSILIEGNMKCREDIKGQYDWDLISNFKKNDKYINGLGDAIWADVRTNIPVEDSKTIKIERISCHQSTADDDIDKVELAYFPPGSIAVINVNMNHSQTKALNNLRSVNVEALSNILRNLSFEEMNWMLYRCSAEERFNGQGFGIYTVPNYGDFVYAGIQGQISVLDTAASKNDLGHPICCNLRDGCWLIDYTTSRIDERLKESLGITEMGNLIELCGFLRDIFGNFNKLPSYLRPSEYYRVLKLVQELIFESALSKMPTWISEGCELIKRYAISTIPFYGYIHNCKYPIDESKYSLAAGLPHFAEGLWRSWGRDTFIALRGILILPGRWKAALDLILRFGAVIKHGLVPNLIGDGGNVKPRYNCRDSTFFWLKAICDFDGHFPNVKIFEKTLVHQNETKTVLELMRQVLQNHLHGIEFREENAGPMIDEHMRQEGFNIKAGVEENTGFIYGGNRFNCGTWMDKMGSSDKAHNRGFPATPRDGSAVELVGLCYSVCKYLVEKEVNMELEFLADKSFTLSKWMNLIKDNFEKDFWISEKGFYRDTVRSHSDYQDGQFRPNLFVTMVVASDLFSIDNARLCLENAKEQLIGHVGMKTLSWKDQNFRGFYHNDDDSDDFNVAKGFNYHNGPEWLWLTGYYLRAKILFAKKIFSLNKDESWYQAEISDCRILIGRLDECLVNSPWKSLPELTNKDGQYCDHSCPAQAWSVGCILEAIHDINEILV